MTEVGTLLQRLQSPAEEERRAAALDLAGVREEAVVEALVELLRREKSRPVQEAAVAALMETGGSDVAEAVAGLLSAPDPYLRNAAVEILQHVGREALGVLDGLLRSPDADLRLFAVHVLGGVRFKEAILLLHRVIREDPEVNVVGAAVEYLGEMGSREEDVACVLEAARRFPEPFVRFAVKQAVEKIRGARVRGEELP